MYPYFGVLKKSFRYRALGLGFRGFLCVGEASRVWVYKGLGFRVQGLGFRVQGLGCRVQGLGFSV